MKTHYCQYAIVGAGISGLFCAYQLIKSGISPQKIILLEKESIYGGRVLGINSPAGPLNLGAGRFNKQAHPLLYRLTVELNEDLKQHKIFQADQPSWLLASNISKVLLSQAKPDKNTSFVEHIYKTLTPIHLENVKKSGFPTLLKKNLPVSEAIRIIQEHPEFASIQESHWVELKNGFAALTKKLCKALHGIKIIYNASVNDIARMVNGNHSVLYSTKSREKVPLKLQAKHLIYANSDVASLSNQYPNIYKASIQASVPVPLFKAFFTFNTAWWDTYFAESSRPCLVQLSTKNEKLGKVYFDSGRKLIWVYNDGEIASSWNKQAKLPSFMKKCIQEISTIFNLSPEKIPKPNWSSYVFWEKGVNYWKSNTLQMELGALQQFYSKNHNLHLISSRFAKRSGWIEGALENVMLLLSNILDHHPTTQQHPNLKQFYNLKNGVPYVDAENRV